MASVRRCGVIAALLPVWAIPFVGCGGSVLEKKTVTVVFRYDDCSSVSSTGTEQKIIEVFRRNGAALTFAVIPFVSTDVHDPAPRKTVPLNDLKGGILRAAVRDGIVDIAQHGYSHQTRDAKIMTEFSGLGYAGQVERIAKGKAFLEAAVRAPVTTFVPPWNSYDSNTLRALEELGFSTLSAAARRQEDEKTALHLLPVTRTLRSLGQAVKKARSASAARTFIVVMFHQYDFCDVERKPGCYTGEEFSDFVGELQSEGDIRLLTISQAIGETQNPNVKHVRSGSAISSALKLLPYSFTKRLRAGPLRSASFLWLCVGALYLTVAAAVALAVVLAGRLVVPPSGRLANIVASGSLAATLVLLVYAFQAPAISRTVLTIGAGVVGFAVGMGLYRAAKAPAPSDRGPRGDLP